MFGNCFTIGDPAYNIQDVSPYGYIWADILKEDPDTGKLVSETMLPSQNLTFSFLYSQQVSSTQQTQAAVAGGTTGVIGLGLAGTIFQGTLGSFTAGYAEAQPSQTKLIFNMADAETVINYRLEITEDDLETLDSDGNITLTVPGYLYAVLCVTDTLYEFSDEDLLALGDTVSKSKGIMGNISSAGQVATNLNISAENLFVEIVFDERRLPYRADNPNYNNRYSLNKNDLRSDLTSNRIKIKNNSYKVSDFLYITATWAKSDGRLRRQAISHFSKIAQIGYVAALQSVEVLDSDINAWNYSLADFFVLKYLSIDDLVKVPVPAYDNDLLSDKINSWRLSQIFSWENISYFFAADARGIWIAKLDRNSDVGYSEFTLLFNSEQLFDTQWFTDYLNELSGKYSDSIISFDYMSPDYDPDIPGMVFDISVEANSFRYDNEKVPYYKLFAQYILKIRSEDYLPIPMLDLIENNLNATNSSVFSSNGTVSDNQIFLGTTQDRSKINISLNNCKFNFSDQSSDVPQVNLLSGGGYYADSCMDKTSVTKNYGYTDPNDFRNKFDLLGITQTGGGFPDLTVMFQLSMPIFYDGFSKGHRIYVEYFVTAGSVERYSAIMVEPLKGFEGGISVISEWDRKVAHLSFKDVDAGTISLNKYSTKNIEQDLSSSEIAYSDNENYAGGLNSILGDIPEYSNGLRLCGEKDFACGYDMYFKDRTAIDRDDVYDVKFYDKLNDEGGGLYSLVLTGTDIVKDITFKFYFNFNDYTSHNEYMSIYFDDNKTKFINKIFFNFSAGLNEKFIDTRYYAVETSENKIYFKFSDLNRFYDLSIKVRTVSAAAFEAFKIDSNNTSITYNRSGTKYIFFENSNNIGVTYTSDDGHSWHVYYDLIRLSEGDTASNPYVLNDINSDNFYLFYVLDNSFLMKMDFNPRLLDCNDVYVRQTRQEIYNEKLDNTISDISVYSESGQLLRKTISYFIEGKSGEASFEQYLDEISRIKGANGDLRFNFIGSQSNMIENMDVSSNYTPILLNNGRKIVIFINNGMLNIKKSINENEWVYVIHDFEFFRLYNSRENIHDITSFEVSYDRESGDVIFFYIYNNMLLMSSFSGNLFGSLMTNSVEDLGNYIKNSISKRATYIAGKMDDYVSEDILLDSEDILLKYYYTKDTDTIKLLNENPVSTNSKMASYYTDKGICRLFYFDDSKVLRGATINGGIPYLDIFRKTKNG